MGGWEEIAKAFVVGAVSIGLVTALFAPGRTTVQGIQAVGGAAQGIFSTAVTGK